MGRIGLPLLASAAQLVAALVVLGPPGWSGAWDFFASRSPTFASALAASRLTVTAIAALMVAWALGRGARAAIRGVAVRRRETVTGAAVLATGLLILAAGVGHHLTTPSVDLGGGSVKEASQAVAR
ncbi:MAG TPA: hypothetical protein VE953_13435 [Terriglobales bacterium]|nr:hypothetical protein [Terriglobales bacterium]